jgi:hypothetical protein
MRHSGCSWRCPVCDGHNLASHEEFPLRDISPCDRNVMLIWTSMMAFIISSGPHITGSNCPNPIKPLHNRERWDLKSPPPLAIWWLHFLAAVYACHINTHDRCWEIWFCVYQYRFCYCHSFAQAIAWDWTVCVCVLSVCDSLYKSLSVECLESIGCFRIGRPTTDKAWLYSASVVTAMPLRHSAQA